MTDWLDGLRLEAGPPYLAMGTRSLDLTRWLTVDDDRDADLAYKAHLIDTVRPVVFAALPDTDAPAEELLALIREWLGSRGVHLAGPFGDVHPLLEAARLVQEDLAVMQRIDGAWVLTAGVVCFPSHWKVSDKIGLPLAGIHAPVAHYRNELADRVDRFHDRLTPDRPVWRRNWSINPTSELHLPGYDARKYHVSSIEPDGSPMWIRSEYQTLRRLPRTDAIVFTIRIQRAPLGVLRDRPDLAAKMLATTSSWDAEKRTYASTGGALVALIGWLGSVADPITQL